MIQIGGVEFAKLKQSAVRLMQSAVRPEAIGGVVERFCGGSLRSRICTDFCFVKYFVKYWEKYFVKGGNVAPKFGSTVGLIMHLTAAGLFLVITWIDELDCVCVTQRF